MVAVRVHVAIVFVVGVCLLSAGDLWQITRYAEMLISCTVSQTTTKIKTTTKKLVKVASYLHFGLETMML